MAKTNLTAHRLKELLDYDPATGRFTWNNVGPPRNAKKGDPAGGLGSKGHWCIKLDDRTYKAHRLAWLFMTGEWPQQQLDHMNGIPADNRFENLRECSTAENCQNQGKRKNNTSGFHGVHWHKLRRKWVASISVGMKRIQLGCFHDPAEAGAAYVKAKLELHIHSPAFSEKHQ